MLEEEGPSLMSIYSLYKMNRVIHCSEVPRAFDIWKQSLFNTPFSI